MSTESPRLFQTAGAPPSDGPVAEGDPWGVFLGTSPAPTRAEEVERVLSLLVHAELDGLVDLREQDPPAFELGMGRIALFAPRRARQLRKIVADRLDARREQSFVPRTLKEELGVAAPDDATGDLLLPRGYTMDHNGTWRMQGESRIAVAGAPIAIVKQGEDIGTRKMQLYLGWLADNGEWPSLPIDRAAAMDPRGLGGCANYGAPWSSLEAKEVVRFLSLFERANRGKIPSASITSHMGWHTRADGPVFLLPGRVLGSKEIIDIVPDDGLRLTLEGWVPHGSWEQWRDVALYLRDYPLALLGVYAGLVAPLLWILRAPSFVLDWSGVTSGGKSSTLRLAASVWGDPADGAGVFQSWSDTAVHVERYAGVLHSLPVILDDTKAFRSGTHQKSPSDLVYLFSQGKGRGRGTIGGVQQTATWRSVLLSSGEAPLAGFGRDAGVYARTLHVQGRPLGDDDARGKEVADWVCAVVAQHHGFAGERFVRWLIAHQNDWPGMVARWRSYAAEIGKAGTGRIAGRLAGYLGALRLTEELAAVALDLPVVAGAGAVDIAVDCVLRRASKEDVPYEAYEVVTGWAVANAARFWPRADNAPAQGWAGRWERESDTIWLIPQVLAQVLAGAQYRLDEVEDAWAAKGVLITRGSQRRFVQEVRGERTPCMGLRLVGGGPRSAGAPEAN